MDVFFKEKSKGMVTIAAEFALAVALFQIVILS